jgi:predicted deacylase
VRADLDDPAVLRLAEAFAPPLLMNSKVRDGSLRAVAGALGKKVLLYEGGEAHRFDAFAIEEGERGIHAVMAALDMRGPVPESGPDRRPLRSERSVWMRAHRGGIFHGEVSLGDRVEAGDRLGFITDAQGTRLHGVVSRVAGVVIGRSTSPLVNRGDAVVHVAEVMG